MSPGVARTLPRSASGSSRSSIPARDILTLERHGARTIDGLRARIGSRMLALAACVYVNYWLGRPSRSLVAYMA
jgi:hypothetical protein